MIDCFGNSQMDLHVNDITLSWNKDIKDIVSGELHICVLYKNGDTKCLGDNSDNQCDIQGFESDILKIIAGNKNTCMTKKSNNETKCFGKYNNGETTTIEEEYKNVIYNVIIGFNRLCLLTVDNIIQCSDHDIYNKMDSHDGNIQYNLCHELYDQKTNQCISANNCSYFKNCPLSICE